VIVQAVIGHACGQDFTIDETRLLPLATANVISGSNQFEILERVLDISGCFMVRL